MKRRRKTSNNNKKQKQQQHYEAYVLRTNANLKKYDDSKVQS